MSLLLRRIIVRRSELKADSNRVERDQAKSNQAKSSQTKASRIMSGPALLETRAGAVKPHRSRLLIVDDDNVHRMIVKKFAAELHFDVSQAGSLEHAIDLLDREAFDCMTLDLSLHAEDGVNILRHLWSSGRRVPVLIVSGADEERRLHTTKHAEAMNFQVLHVVKKPLDIKALRQALAELRYVVEINRGEKS
jgi:CheY-like chemotaxis protein